MLVLFLLLSQPSELSELRVAVAKELVDKLVSDHSNGRHGSLS